MGDLDSSVIKRTQQTLGKYVKRPPLTEKLLTKPPFRFLHDVFNAVIKETGCFVGLYTPEELNSDNIKDRDDKMKFLQKMIDVIKIISNQNVTVRTSKIVAGQEPEKTNELLQLMGEVIEKKLDWKSAVEQVVNSKGLGVPTSGTKSKVHDKQNEKKNKDKANEKYKDKENRVKDVKTKDATKKVVKSISPPTKAEKPSKKHVEEREKEKPGKTAKDQISKDPNEKAGKRSEKPTEKPKLLKSRTGSKEKTPSPIKNDVPKEAETVSLTDNELHMTTKDDSIALELKMEKEPSEMANKSNPIENQRRNSKTLEPNVMGSEILLENDPSVDILKQSIRTSNDVESRKSSARHRRSSGSSRRSSVNVVARDDHKTLTNGMKDGNDNINDTISLLKTSNGTMQNNELSHQEMPELVQKSILQQQKSNSMQFQNSNTNIKPQSPNQSAAPPPTAVPPTPTEVRREHTFTRENSHDSNASNFANRPRTSLRPPSARPASARPGAPRRRDRNIEIVLQPNDQVKLSGINVKLESFGDLDDDGENLVVIEDANTVNIVESVEEVNRGEESGVENNAEQQGHLVQQILETQKELMQQQKGTNSIGKNEKDVDLTTNSIGRQSSARQMNNLRDVIQNLTKSVNPFGKLMDFIPEDIDAMQLELTMWRDTYTQVANDLRREKSLTESATEPMKNQLVQIEANTKEFMEMIDTSRSKILQNSEKIYKMLAGQ
ncbi:TRAF3-interacting protein 1 [Rhagoletis pomonella]|uniref:TRAF3-interacting protein 1 n=1 Tax=Rhagoletis pomonella TaxID=28610 RepID=UPI00177C9711|nr:TRAF3-interacting protein 1 [Rhagoletis pomonella]